jgi:PPOX class probable F420-dependent enzyme
MTDGEVLAFLDEQRTVTCASNGPDGWPHLAPLWFVLRSGRVWAWTYAASQKVRNLERDPRATLQVEAGESYDQLRGVLLRTEAALHRDRSAVAELGADLFRRYGGTGELAPAVEELIRGQAAKRVGLEFVEVGARASWDHRKLPAGVY